MRYRVIMFVAGLFVGTAFHEGPLWFRGGLLLAAAIMVPITEHCAQKDIWVPWRLRPTLRRKKT